MMAAGRGGGGRGRGAGRTTDAASGAAATTAAGSAATKKGGLAAAVGDDDGFDAAEVDEDDSDDLFDPWNIDEPDGRFDDEEAEDDADASKAFDVESLVNGDRGIAGGAGVEDEDEDTVGGFDDLDDDEEEEDPDLDDLDEDDDEDDDEDEPAPRSRWGKRALDDTDDDDDDEGMGEHDDDDVDTPIRQRKRPATAEESVLRGSTVEEEEPLGDTVDDLDADLGLLSVAGADVLVGEVDVDDDEPVVFDSEEPQIPSQRVPAKAVGGAASVDPEEEGEEEGVDDLEDEALGSIDLTQLLRSRTRPSEDLAAPGGGTGGDLASLFDDAHLDESTPPAVPGSGDMVPAATARFAEVADSPEANVAARAAEKSAFDADDDYEVDGPQGLDFYTNDGEEYEGDADEFGVTQDTSFGRVWALNDDNYVTITEPGEAFAFVDEDVVANDEDADDAGSSESLHEHEATRRGAQPSWGSSTASAWPAAMGGSDALDMGSKEWAARVAYERSTQASAKDMYRWSHKNAGPPAGLDDLFPDYRPAELPKLARLTLDVQDLPLDDETGDGASTRIAGPEPVDDQSEYLSFYQELYKYEGEDDDSAVGGDGAGVVGVAAASAGASVANGSMGVGVNEGSPLDAAEEEAQLEALEEATQQRLQDVVATTGRRAARAGASAADYHALSRTMTFPSEYRFKAVGDGEDFLRSVLADIEAVTGVPVAPEAVVEEPSDRYRRLNIGVSVQSAVQIGAVFEAIRANRHVRFCFSPCGWICVSSPLAGCSGVFMAVPAALCDKTGNRRARALCRATLKHAESLLHVRTRKSLSRGEAPLPLTPKHVISF